MKRILAAATTLAMLAPGLALASVNSSNITIGNSNSGAIFNSTSASASTGGNTAGGSYGGNGDDGGSADIDDVGQNTGGGTGGDGGNGGNASAGGLVDTGDANADAATLNTLNSNDVSVKSWGGMNSSNLTIASENRGFIGNSTRAKARTGGNDADGSYGGHGDDGGDADIDNVDQNTGGGTGGDGGNGGVGGTGGEVYTGEATSNAGTINVLNTNIVRVRN